MLADPSGTSALRIGVPDDIVTASFGRLLAQFARRYREIRLDVTTGLSRDLKRRFRGGELDLVVVKEAVTDGDARATFPEPLAWVEADDSPAWQDPLPLVAFPPGGLYRDLMIDRIEREGRRWYIAFTGNSLGSVLSAIEAGLRVSVLPVSTIGQHAVRASELFSAEAPLSLAVYAWEADGPIGDVLQSLIAGVADR